MVRKANISIDSDLMCRIDDHACKLGLNRSQFISMCCAKYLDSEKQLPIVKEVLAGVLRASGSALTGEISRDELSDILDMSESSLKSFSHS